jgi:hypothetical protein
VCSCEYATLTTSTEKQKTDRLKWWLRNAEEKMNGNESASVDLKPFHNWVTGTILATIIVMIMFGILFIVLSHSNFWFFSGIGITCLGVLAWVYGYTEFPENPPTAGALFCWNVPITREVIGKDGKPVKCQIVVGGKTLLADYFPFYISAVSIDMSNKDKDFTISVTSSDDVQLEGKVTITARPDENDTRDFIQAGAKLEDVFKQIADIVITKSRRYAKKHPQRELIVNGQEKIGEPLKGDLDQGSFGITIFKVNVVLNQPDDIRKAMQGQVTEKYERDNELMEYKTNLEAAQALQNAYAKDRHRSGKPVPSLRDCLEEILEQRLIRDGKATGIKNKGGTTINIPKT